MAGLFPIPARGAAIAGSATVDGPLAVLVQMSPALGSISEILEVRNGRVARVLVRGLPYPPMGGLASAPCGRTLAYGEAATLTSINPSRTAGLWLVPTAGGRARRLLLPPPSVDHNVLGIGPVAWSPDGRTLAYAVNPGGGVWYAGRAEPGPGIWLTPFDRAIPRRLVTTAQLGAVAGDPMGSPFQINQLSWSADGRTLAVSTFRPMAGSPRPGQVSPAVLAVDRATGVVRTLVGNGADGVYAPRGAALAYVVPPATRPRVGWPLRVVTPGGRGRVLAVGAIDAPAWAPDGRSLAYIDGGTVIRRVDLTTGRNSIMLTISQVGALPAGARFVRVAWLHGPC